MPIDLRLKELMELNLCKKGMLETDKTEILSKYEDAWQDLWDSSFSGRFTHQLLPSVCERKQLIHLDDVDHIGIQLLSGHGAFGSYLFKYNKKTSPICELCNKYNDHPSHFIECDYFEDIIEEMNNDIVKHNIALPWNINSLLRHKTGSKILLKYWSDIFHQRSF